MGRGGFFIRCLPLIFMTKMIYRGVALLPYVYIVALSFATITQGGLNSFATLGLATRGLLDLALGSCNVIGCSCSPQLTRSLFLPIGALSDVLRKLTIGTNCILVIKDLLLFLTRTRRYRCVVSGGIFVILLDLPAKDPAALWWSPSVFLAGDSTLS